MIPAPHLPQPFAALVWLAVNTGWLIWQAFRHTSNNIRTLGWPWLITYWLAVASLFRLGAWGQAAMHGARRGNDAFEYDPARRGGAWLGRAVSIYRLQIKAEADSAAAATVGGYVGGVVLLVVGFLWAWLAVAVAVWALLRALELRRRRTLVSRMTART
jgi:hypothetical protein